MKIKYNTNSSKKAEWGTKQALLQRYIGLNVHTLNRWLSEMRKNDIFCKGVINPTHKIVLINFATFEEFLYWKQHHYIRNV